MCGRADPRRMRCALAAAALVSALGCAVGPDFTSPKPPATDQYTQGALAPETLLADGRSQRFAPGAAVPTDWYQLFRSPELQSRIERALAANPTLQAARASLRRSEDDLRAGYGVFLPQIDAGSSASRQHPFIGIANVPRRTFDLYTLSATVDYALDVFGEERRTVEGESAQVDFQRYETAAAYLTLIGNVVNATIAEAAYAEQIDDTRRLIATEQDQVHILGTQAEAGTLPYASVLALETQLAATEAQLPPLEQKLAESRHLLATLLGEEPAAWTSPFVSLASLELPREVPVTLPSELVRQRPDILAAEAQLHEASAQIGVATAALYPHLTLTGTYGWTDTSPSPLFSGPNAIWLYGAQLATPLFHGGSLWFKRRSAIDSYEQSLASYRQTVLSGLAQVADLLRGLEHDAEQVEAAERQEAAAHEGLRLISVNYQSGVANYLEVLISDVQENQAMIASVGGRAQRLQDSVALFVALGGGWWNAKDEILQE